MTRILPPLLSTLVMIIPLQAVAAATPQPQPEYHSLRRAADKSVPELKPETRHRELPPVMVELRAHFHPDGRTTLECEMDHGATAGAGSASVVEEPRQ